MRIFTQNLFAIVPLYIGLALAGGFLMYTNELQELEWGLREEANSIAVTTAEFLKSDALQSVYHEGASDPYAKMIAKPLERIMGLERLRKLDCFTPDGKQLAFTITGGASGKIAENFGFSNETGKNELKEDDEILRQSPQILQKLDKGKVFITPIRQLDSARARIAAYAPITNDRHQLVGVIRAELAANQWLTHRSQLYARVTRMVLFVILLGVGIALFLSNLISGEVKDLSDAATEVTEGNLDRQIVGGRIQELSDLSNTFNTMSDVLKETLVKNKRSLIESEQFRGDDELAQVYKEIFSPLVATSYGSLRVVAEHIGSGVSGEFFSSFQYGGDAFIVLGCLEENADLAAVVNASGVVSFINQTLQRHSPEEVIREAVDLFDIHCLDILVWKGSAKNSHWRSYHSSVGQATRQELTLEADRPLLLATFQGAPFEQTQRYAQIFGHLTPDELIEDIKIVLPPDLKGALMVLKWTP
jgi:HAMP domain-containing protein